MALKEKFQGSQGRIKTRRRECSEEILYICNFCNNSRGSKGGGIGGNLGSGERTLSHSKEFYKRRGVSRRKERGDQKKMGGTRGR